MCHQLSSQVLWPTSLIPTFIWFSSSIWSLATNYNSILFISNLSSNDSSTYLFTQGVAIERPGEKWQGVGGGNGLNPVRTIPSPKLTNQMICPPPKNGSTEGTGNKVSFTAADTSSHRNTSPEITAAFWIITGLQRILLSRNGRPFNILLNHSFISCWGHFFFHIDFKNFFIVFHFHPSHRQWVRSENCIKIFFFEELTFNNRNSSHQEHNNVLLFS